LGKGESLRHFPLLVFNKGIKFDPLGKAATKCCKMRGVKRRTGKLSYEKKMNKRGGNPRLETLKSDSGREAQKARCDAPKDRMELYRVATSIRPQT